MSDLELWKLGTDVALVFALAYLCYRFAGSSRRPVDSGRSRELEVSLKELIKDAESTGRELDAQLSKRQGTLQRLLGEIESAESRLRNLINEAAQAPIPKSAPPPPSARAPSARAATEPTFNPAPRVEINKEPPSFERERQFSDRAPTAPAAASDKLNIFGEPVGSESSRPRTAIERHREVSARLAEGARMPGLERSVELEVSTQTRVIPYGGEVQQGVQSIYAAAEELIKTGRDIEYVAAKTKLPIEEVRLLAHMVGQEKAARMTEQAGPVEGDSRLGVLGNGMKRQRLTV